MKRLIKKASNKTLYHATSIESLNKIISSGELKPQEVTQSGWAKIENVDKYFDGDIEEYNRQLANYTGYTFFATYEASSMEYGARAAVQSGLSDAYAIIVAELSEDILMPDLNDAPNATTWQESEEQSGQVAVLGSISTSQITEVIIILRNIHERVETTLDNWKADVKTIMATNTRQGYLDADDCYELWDKLEIPHSGNK